MQSLCSGVINSIVKLRFRSRSQVRYSRSTSKDKGRRPGPGLYTKFDLRGLSEGIFKRVFKGDFEGDRGSEVYLELYLELYLEVYLEVYLGIDSEVVLEGDSSEDFRGDLNRTWKGTCCQAQVRSGSGYSSNLIL